jgi:23S rRNA pseudouridine1911/1915/1917 synthase
VLARPITETVVETEVRLDEALTLPARIVRELCAAGRVRVRSPGERFGHAVLEGRPWLEAGTRVAVLDESLDPRLLPEDIAIRLLHDDEALLVVDKPARLVTYPGPGHPAGTLANALRGLGGPLSSLEGSFRPGIVHRLDFGTSGAIVVARTDAAHRALSEQLVARTLHRTYIALVCGEPAWDARNVESFLGQRRPGRTARGSVEPERGQVAITGLRVLGRSAGLATVEARPLTGRRHQIRVHLAEAGHPVVGDTLYGGPTARRAARSLGLRRPALHALRVELRHPVTATTLTVTAPLPPDLASVNVLAASVSISAVPSRSVATTSVARRAPGAGGGTSDVTSRT